MQLNARHVGNQCRSLVDTLDIVDSHRRIEFKEAPNTANVSHFSRRDSAGEAGISICGQIPHEIGEKSSKIVPQGAPFSYFFKLRARIWEEPMKIARLASLFWRPLRWFCRLERRTPARRHSGSITNRAIRRSPDILCMTTLSRGGGPAC